MGIVWKFWATFLLQHLVTLLMHDPDGDDDNNSNDDDDDVNGGAVKCRMTFLLRHGTLEISRKRH